MLISLHTGPKSAPRLALFDTTGISIVHEATPEYPNKRPETVCGKYGRQNRPTEIDGDEAMAKFEVLLSAEVAAWEVARDSWLDGQYRNAAVYHGCRFVGYGENCDDAAVYVHETVEEIIAIVKGGP